MNGMNQILTGISRLTMTCVLVGWCFLCSQTSVSADPQTSLSQIITAKTPSQIFSAEDPPLFSSLATLTLSEENDSESSLPQPLQVNGRNTSNEKLSKMPILPNRNDDFAPILNIIKWMSVVLSIAVFVLVGMRKWTRVGAMGAANSYLKHLESIAITNQFHAHLLEVGTQQFFVTTDRSGIKTVTVVTDWNRLNEFDEHEPVLTSDNHSHQFPAV